MKRAKSGWIALILFLLVVTTAHAATYKQTEEMRYAPDDVTELYIRGVNGGITFLPWEASHIQITAIKEVTTWSSSRARRLAERISVSAKSQGGQVHVEVSVPRGQLFARQGVSFEVRVPEGWYGTINLATSNGSIRAEAIHGDVRLESSNGSITVKEHAGRLHVRTSNGRIELHDVNTNLYARTSNGRVTLLGGTLRGAGEIHTSNGSITLQAALKDDADYAVRTSNGSMTLTLADPVDVALDLRTSNGSVQVTGAAEMQVSEVGRSSLKGRIGKGSANLEARTSNGSITLTVERDFI